MNHNALPLLLQPETFAEQPAHDDVLLVIVAQAQVFNAGHIPGSVLVEPAELVSGDKPAVGSLPSEEKLSALFSRIGLNSNSHVVVYDDEGGGWAGRLVWTLHILGHQRVSCLNGGLVAWLKSGLPVESGMAQPQASNYQAHIDQSQLRSKQDVLASLEDDNTVIWDARSPQEYAGSKITALRNGHIPGAVNLDWLELMDQDNDLRLRPMDVLKNKLQHLGIEPGKQIITHCQTHHRSGLSYLLGRALGLDITAYDGSWSEWGNDPDTPIETGS